MLSNPRPWILSKLRRTFNTLWKRLGVLKEANQIAEQLGVDLSIPRIVGRQQHRSNHPATNPTEYWRRSLIFPYLDSIASSLELRFSTENTPAYASTCLH